MRSGSPMGRVPIRTKLEGLKWQVSNIKQHIPELTMQITQPALPPRQGGRQPSVDIPPPASLMTKTGSCIYPTDAPILSSERQWLCGQVDQLLGNPKLLTAQLLARAFQYMHELARHYFSAHKLPAIGENPVVELALCQAKLAERLYQEVQLHGFDPDEERHQFESQTQLFQLQQQLKDLEAQIGILKSQSQNYQALLTQAQFDNTELSKKYTAEFSSHMQLKKQVADLQQQLENYENKTEVAKKTRYFSAGPYRATIPEKDEHRSRCKENEAGHCPRQQVVLSAIDDKKDLFSSVRGPINEQKQKDQVNSSMKFTTKLSGRPTQEVVPISAIQSGTVGENSIDISIDQIPCVSRVDTTRRCTQQQSFSRLKTASEEAGRKNFDSAARLTDCYQYGDNVVENRYGHSDIAHLDELEYNSITKDVILRQNEVQEHVIQQAAARVVDGFGKPAEDAAWLVEQTALSRQDTTPAPVAAGGAVAPALDIAQPAMVIERHLNPLYGGASDPDGPLRLEYGKHTTPVDWRPHCQPVQQTTLEAVWAVGGLAYCETTLAQLTLVENGVVPPQRRGLLTRQLARRAPAQVFDEYREQELLVNDNDKEVIMPQLISDYYKAGAKDPCTIFNLVAHYLRTTVATGRGVAYNAAGLRVKPPTSVSKQIDAQGLIDCLADKDFQKAYADAVVKRYPFYKLAAQARHTTQDVRRVLGQLSPRTFGLERIQGRLAAAGYQLYDLEGLLLELNWLVYARQAAVWAQRRHDQRAHTAAPLGLYGALLQRHGADRAAADRQFASLAYSCLLWSAYLSLTDGYLKKTYVCAGEPTADQFGRPSVHVNGAQPHLPLLFLLLLNDFFSPQDTEFLLAAYQAVMDCAGADQVQVYGYVDALAAGVAVGQLFSLHNLDIRMGVEQQVRMMQQQIHDKSVPAGDCRLINVGQVMQIILRGRETIIQLYLNHALQSIGQGKQPQVAGKAPKQGGTGLDAVITAAQFRTVLEALGKDISRLPLLDRFIETVYRQACLQNCQTTLRQLLMNCEAMMMTNGYLYDVVCDYVPLYQLTRLLYPGRQSGRRGKIRASPALLSVSDVVTNLLIHQGNGMSHLGKPFELRGCKIVADADPRLVWLGHALQECTHVCEHSDNSVVLRRLLVQLLDGLFSLKQFRFEKGWAMVQEQLVQFVGGILGEILDPHAEQEGVFGLPFTDEVRPEQLLLISDERFWEVE